MEAQRKVILKQLEEKQVRSSKEADDYEVKVRSVNKILDQLKAGETQKTFSDCLNWSIPFAISKIEKFAPSPFPGCCLDLI